MAKVQLVIASSDPARKELAVCAVSDSGVFTFPPGEKAILIVPGDSVEITHNDTGTVWLLVEKPSSLRTWWNLLKSARR